MTAVAGSWVPLEATEVAAGVNAADEVADEADEAYTTDARASEKARSRRQTSEPGLGKFGSDPSHSRGSGGSGFVIKVRLHQGSTPPNRVSHPL